MIELDDAERLYVFSVIDPEKDLKNELDAIPGEKLKQIRENPLIQCFIGELLLRKFQNPQFEHTKNEMKNTMKMKALQVLKDILTNPDTKYSKEGIRIAKMLIKPDLDRIAKEHWGK